MRTNGFQINHLNYKHVRLTAFFSFAVILLSAVYFLQPFTSESSYADTDSASGTYNGTTYSLTTAVSDLNLGLTALPSGSATYGKQTINVTTNAPGGYQLYVQTTGDLAGTKAGAATSDSIAALSSDNAALSTNTWGYTQTTPNDDADTAATQTIWSTPPSTLTQIDSTSSAATSGRDTDIYYGIKADNSLDGDTYSGTITYTTIASDVTSANESTNGLIVSPTTSNTNTTTTITITTPLMASSSLTASEITAAVGSYPCVSITITAQAPLTFTCSITPTTDGIYNVSAVISKYSKTFTKTSGYIAKTPPTQFSQITNMQDATPVMCDNATPYSTNNTQYTLKDSRTNQSYLIRKLADNRCWMVENLYLTGGKSLTSADSDIDESTVLTQPDGTTAVGAYKLPSSTSYFDGNTQTMNTGTKTTGSYYTWNVATAGEGTTGSTTVQTPTNSVCPKGWKLPYEDSTKTENNEFYTLYSKYGSVNAFITPFNFTGVGYYLAGTYTGKANADFWSRVGKNANNAYFLFMNSGNVNTSYTGYKYYGNPMRCLLPKT